MTQYAIIKSGGKQYRVQEGDVIDVELIDAKEDGTIEFNDILLGFNGKKTIVGTPTIANGLVRATLVEQVRGPKVVAYKYKRRKNYHRKVGHRQNYMRVRITELSI